MTARPPSRGPLAALAVMLLLAGGLRLYLAWCAHVPTLDTAVVGQMALDILKAAKLLPVGCLGERFVFSVRGTDRVWTDLNRPVI